MPPTPNQEDDVQWRFIGDKEGEHISAAVPAFSC